MHRTLSEWVDYIQTLHAREIELSLERAREVYQRLYPSGVSFHVISIAGTNGKGSTAELLNSMYHQAGYSVGKYTSPHISRFNERYQIDRQDVDDSALLEAFGRVEHHRQSTKLTFFEFGTLLAVELFEKAGVDIAMMEVGLGGRLDAVNILPADLAIVTSISLDHMAWLGDDVEQIGREKIGIARRGKPCVLGMSEPPASVLEHTESLGITPQVIEQNFSVRLHLSNTVATHWEWHAEDLVLEDLPLPYHQSNHQLSNAAVAVQAVQSLQELLPLEEDSIRKGIAAASVIARCQVVSKKPHVVLDVAHNQDSVAALSSFIRNLGVSGQTYAVCGMLADKQIAETLAQLLPEVDHWYFATINHPRGASAERIETLLTDHIASHDPSSNSLQSRLFPDVESAFLAAQHKLQRDDCLLVFGSFFIVSDIMPLIKK
ncbi:MAG: bifunctional tetrahydrofolate synthase/dihydrofolate synthase [Pseudomonadota bacterium]